jgi:2-iminobutanoate/2-iminopropanoate deaminase
VTAPVRQEIRCPGLPEPISHYTDAVRFGDLLFVSGCAPLDAAGELVCAGDVVGQARRVFANMETVLAAAGASFSDVLKVTVYLVDAADRAQVNTVREAVFGPSRPASTLVEVAALAIPDMRVEVEAIAGIAS